MGGIEVEVEGAMLVQKIIQIQFGGEIVRSVVRVGRIVALFPAIGRDCVVAIAVPVVAVLGGIIETVLSIAVAGIEIEVETVEQEVVPLERDGTDSSLSMRVRLADIEVDASRISKSMPWICAFVAV